MGISKAGSEEMAVVTKESVKRVRLLLRVERGYVWLFDAGEASGEVRFTLGAVAFKDLPPVG